MAICKACGKEKGCGCSFSNVPGIQFAVCPECKRKFLAEQNQQKNDNESKINKPNVQGV